MGVNMDINNILQEYDSLFGKLTLPQIENFLYEHINEAVKEQDNASIIILLNEMIGLCRDTSQKEKALSYSASLKNLLDKMNQQGTPNYATSMQNIANAYRAFGLFDEAQEAFELIENTYRQYLDKKDILWATLYNNWGLLCQETNAFHKASELQKRALDIIRDTPDADIKIAITMTNLANSLFAISTEDSLYEGNNYLDQALKIFIDDREHDFHYGAAVVAKGDYFATSLEWSKATQYYRKGLVEILIHTGKTDGFYRVLEKYNRSQEMLTKTDVLDKWESNLSRCKDFYKKYGIEMIHKNFPEYEARIAVGMVGEGSDCFGFDDKISTDHDYDVGFCMWLTDDDYSAIGDKLQESYENLISDATSQRFMSRRGVFKTSEFYKKSDRESCEEFLLAQLVNGEVFRDDLGEFSKKRKALLLYYPKNIWRSKLANLLHDYAQYAQSNYARMMVRKDAISASLCVSKAIETAMDIVYILNKTYAPYYKWKRKGIEQFGREWQEILWICDEIALLSNQAEAWEGVEYSSPVLNKRDKCVILLELLARTLLEKMKELGFVTGEDPFLERYIPQILNTQKGEETNMNVDKKKELIEEIVKHEWKQFDKVKNEGGRADCQDDYKTFSIMRKSQYLTWNQDLLQSYLNDLIEAEEKGWNLITEKYARMLKSTAPDKYVELEKDLPIRSDDRSAIAEEIIRIQVLWMEEFAKEYPYVANNARVIHTAEDTPFNTSYETYLRGELGTYSEQTFLLYGRFIASLLQEGKNLAFETMSNTAQLYGYESLEDIK